MSFFGAKSVIPATNPPNIVDWNEKHVKQAAMAFFHKADKDNSNSMDCAEIVSFLNEINTVTAKYNITPIANTAERAEELLAEHDADEDGTMSITEFEPLFAALVDDLKCKALLQNTADGIWKFALGISPEITEEVFEQACEAFKTESDKNMMKLKLDEDLMEERTEWLEGMCSAIAEIFSSTFDEEPATAASWNEFWEAVVGEAEVDIPTPLPAKASTAAAKEGPVSKKAPKAAKAPPPPPKEEDEDDEEDDE